MFKHILIATDGSPLSRTAIDKGIELAGMSRASVVGIYVRPPMPLYLYSEGGSMIPPEVPAAYSARTKATAAGYLAEIATAAQKAKVAFEAIDVEDGSPADAILRVAGEKRCDLIVMASHGRKGLSRVLLGSETSKVLTHATQAVLVTR